MHCIAVCAFHLASIKYHYRKLFSWKKSCELSFFKKSSQVFRFSGINQARHEEVPGVYAVRIQMTRLTGDTPQVGSGSTVPSHLTDASPLNAARVTSGSPVPSVSNAAFIRLSERDSAAPVLATRVWSNSRIPAPLSQASGKEKVGLSEPLSGHPPYPLERIGDVAEGDSPAGLPRFILCCERNR